MLAAPARYEFDTASRCAKRPVFGTFRDSKEAGFTLEASDPPIACNQSAARLGRGT